VALTSALALTKIVYIKGAREIILAVNVSLKGWRAMLIQLDDSKWKHST